MADGSARYIALAKEVVEKTAPGGAYQKYRNTGGSGVSNERTSVVSNEIRSDRQISVMRLGNNQPNVELPFEFSYRAFDDLLEGALGNDWDGGVAISDTVSFGSATNTIDLDDASSWETKGLSVGDPIVIRGSVSNDGLYLVKAFANSTGTSDRMTVFNADGTTDASFTLESAADVHVEAGYELKEFDATATTFTVSATNKTITASSASFTGIFTGDTVYIDGFAEAGNNGYKKVTAVSSTVLTFGEATLANETLNTGDLYLMTYVSMLTVGLEEPTYTVEEGFTDINEYHYTTGTKVASMSMSIQPDTIVTGDFSLQGQTYSGFSATPVSGSTLEPLTTEVFDSYNGDLYFGGDLQCVITGIDFTVDNDLNRRYALMQKDACSIGVGRSNVTGTINAYFIDSDLSKKFNDEEVFEARIRLEDLDDNSYTIGWPRLKFTTDSRDTTENDVTESFGFQALGGDETYTNMFVRKQPAIPA